MKNGKMKTQNKIEKRGKNQGFGGGWRFGSSLFGTQTSFDLKGFPFFNTKKNKSLSNKPFSSRFSLQKKTIKKAQWGKSV